MSVGGSISTAVKTVHWPPNGMEDASRCGEAERDLEAELTRAPLGLQPVVKRTGRGASPLIPAVPAVTLATALGCRDEDAEVKGAAELWGMDELGGNSVPHGA